MTASQLKLPFGCVRNSNLFSNHWLEHRLSLEPEWQAKRDAALRCLEIIEALWKEQAHRVSLYESEQPLEEAFIQPVLRALGWPLLYQAFVDGRKPDYALFLEHAAFDAALNAGRKSPEFWPHAAIVADAKAWDISLDRPMTRDAQREFPPQQIEWYLDRTHLDFGVLTNGRLWRLSPRLRAPFQPRFEHISNSI